MSNLNARIRASYHDVGREIGDIAAELKLSEREVFCALSLSMLRSKDRVRADELFVEAYSRRCSLQTTAKLYGVSASTVRKSLVRLGVERRPCSIGAQVSAELTRIHIDRDVLKRLYDAGHGVRSIGEQLRCSDTTVINRMKEYGIGRRQAGDCRRARATREHYLNDKKVWQLRVIALHCKNWTKVGNMFGVGRNTARAAGTGASWTHVPMPKITPEAGVSECLQQQSA